MTIEQELIKAQAEASAARQDLSEAQSIIEGLKDDISSADVAFKKLSAGHDILALEVTRLNAEAVQRETDHQAALLAKDAEVEKRAHLRANEIARAQGVAPVRDAATDTRSSGDIAAQLGAITDPVQRAHFVKDNLAAIRAAAKIQRPN